MLGWRGWVTLAAAALSLCVAASLIVIVVAAPALASHCDSSSLTPEPPCQPGHTIVDNWPTEQPVSVVNWPTDYPTVSTFGECNVWAAGVEASDRNGCVLEVRPDYDWSHALMLAMVLVVAATSASVVTALVRR